MNPLIMVLFSLFFALCALPLAPHARAGVVSSDDDIVREFLWEQFRGLDADERPKVGVALSGGGARGFAHTGVLEVLHDAGFPIDCLSGSSMGAVIGAFYCSGMPVSKIWELGRKASFSNISKDFKKVRLLRLLVSDKLFSSKDMEDFIAENIGDLKFSRMNIPFACVAMDLKTGEKIVFKNGSVALAVRASMNLPGLFAPVEYRHRYLVDGGVVDFIPVDVAKMLGADWVLASVTEGDFSRSDVDNVFLSLQQVIDIRGALLAKSSKRMADFVIEPEVGDIKSSELTRSLEAGEEGVVKAYAGLKKAKESLILFSLPWILDAFIHDQ